MYLSPIIHHCFPSTVLSFLNHLIDHICCTVVSHNNSLPSKCFFSCSCQKRVRVFFRQLVADGMSGHTFLRSTVCFTDYEHSHVHLSRSHVCTLNPITTQTALVFLALVTVHVVTAQGLHSEHINSNTLHNSKGRSHKRMHKSQHKPQHTNSGL